MSQRTYHVCYDVNLYVDVVRDRTVAPTLAQIRPSTPAGMLMFFAIHNPDARLHFGDHIADQIVRTLTGKYGWSDTEARTWAERCRSIAAATGACSEIPVVTDRNSFARAFGMWRVPDVEDAQVVHICTEAAFAHGEVVHLVTFDKELQLAEPPMVRPVGPEQFLGELERDLRPARTREPLAA